MEETETETTLDDMPEWLERKILLSLDFSGILIARAVCGRWNEILMPILAKISILNIKMDKSPAAKKFRRGKWNPDLIAPYQEVRLIPKPLNAFLKGKAKTWRTSSIKHFIHVQKFTIFENGSFLHFIHRYMANLPNLKYVQIRELFSDEESAADAKYYFSGHCYTRAILHQKTWTRAIDNLSKVQTLRIRIFSRVATLVYIQLFTFQRCNLVSVELDFSKIFGLPLPRYHLNELFEAVTEMIENCYRTLRHLRLKTAIRVDTDLDFARSDEDIEPFFEFLLALRNSIWTKLRLQQLALIFPTMNLAMSLCDSTLYPFLHSQKVYLKRVSFCRVVPNSGLDAFVAQFPPPLLNKFEFTFHFTDMEIFPQPVTSIRGMEVLLSDHSELNVDSLLALSRSRLQHPQKQILHFKILSGHTSLNFVKPDMTRITENFYNVRTLEILDSSPNGKLNVSFTNEEFNLILTRMCRLVSLKMSNVSLLSDAGITTIPEAKIRHMKEIGVYFLSGHSVTSAPVVRAKELRYLDLRDLRNTVSDCSVYFAFQHMRKLEKISFHGSHAITTWGKRLLKNKKGRNPYFEAIFRSNDDDYAIFGSYALPCIDFP